MNILAFVLFGVINGLVLHIFNPKKEEEGIGEAMLMGIFGALSGGTLAVLFFSGKSILTFNTTLLFVVFLEGILLSVLLGKITRKV